jgi:tRNA G10  N-methylase Trm11
MVIFCSELEKIMLAEELRFDAAPGFGVYRKFLGHAIAHPAKANTKLLEFLVKQFTEEGDTVLDPMAGSGSTGVVAALQGRNAVCVELERKFWEWMEQAKRKVEAQPTLTAKGSIRNICGDARKLSELLKSADVVLTSPPYSESMTKKRKGYTAYTELANSREMPHDTRDDNIANLPHGEVDSIITSPPYSDGYSKNPKKNLKKETYLEAMLKVYSEMFKVLKPNGKAIIIIKPFIRNKKVVDLPWHTWLLLERAGFKLAKLFKLRLQQESFWRILYSHKFPNVPKIAHEYVLVCQKDEANVGLAV